MNAETERPTVTNVAIAKEVEGIKLVDPGLGAYHFGDLGQYVQFSDIMASAGEMLPLHLRNKPALCLAVTMRAVHWGFDPFALAMETYQAQSGGIIGYQAKVFVAALRAVAGITLKFRFEGEFKIIDKPALSRNGKQTAKRSAVGNRKCIAYATVDGDLLEYETPELDQITIKNSPQWHNDPDQQLSYYAGRGWPRRFRPDAMMGAYSNDEVQNIEPMRDVTPQKSKFSSLADKAREAKDGTGKPTTDTDQDASQKTDGEDSADTDTSEAADDAATDKAHDQDTSPEFQAGAEAAKSGDVARHECPHTDDPDAALAWLAGYDAQITGEDE